MAQAAPRPVGRPARLSRERILAAATEMIGESGAAELSIRKLARRLGVTPPALYQYFTGTEEISARVAQELCRGLPEVDPRSGVPIRRQLVDFFMAVYRVQLAHPRVLTNRVGSPAWRVLTGHGNAIARALLEAGCERLSAVVAIRALSGLVGSYADHARENDGADYAELLRRELAALPESDRDVIGGIFPNPSMGFEELTRFMLDKALSRLLPELG